MNIIWDEPKRQRNLAIHGWDFADLDIDFFMRSVVVPANEGRSMAIGGFRDTAIAVVFRPLGTEGIAIISMRHASRRERSYL